MKDSGKIIKINSINKKLLLRRAMSLSAVSTAVVASFNSVVFADFADFLCGVASEKYGYRSECVEGVNRKANFLHVYTEKGLYEIIKAMNKSLNTANPYSSILTYGLNICVHSNLTPAGKDLLKDIKYIGINNRLGSPGRFAGVIWLMKNGERIEGLRIGNREIRTAADLSKIVNGMRGKVQVRELREDQADYGNLDAWCYYCIDNINPYDSNFTSVFPGEPNPNPWVEGRRTKK